MGMKREAYEEALKPLTLELVSMARWVKATDARVVVLFEGRDTAGKGGAIGAVREALNPRQCRTVANRMNHSTCGKLRSVSLTYEALVWTR